MPKHTHHTHTLRRTGLCNWVQLALLPIGYQYEPFRFVCAGRGDATHAALHRPSLQSDHPWEHMALLWHSTWSPSYRTQQAALQAAVANRGVAPHHSYSTPVCLATRPFSCKVVNRHGTESETPGSFTWYVCMAGRAQEVRTYVQVISSPRSGLLRWCEYTT